MENCIFCKIIKGEAPSTKIYEDDVCMAFLSLHQNSDGHTILIPKEHSRNILETPDNILEHLGKELKHIGKAVKEGVEAEGLNIISNLEKAAGQVVFHTHIHLIPRYENDGFKNWQMKGGFTDEQAIKIAEKIKNFL